MPKLNVELLQRVRQHILEEPARLFMADWIIKGEPGEMINSSRSLPACGTMACIAGWAVLLTDRKENHLHVMARATELLGLTTDMADELFYSTHWKYAPDYFAAGHENDRVRQAEVAAREIDHFIERYAEHP